MRDFDRLYLALHEVDFLNAAALKQVPAEYNPTEFIELKYTLKIETSLF